MNTQFFGIKWAASEYAMAVPFALVLIALFYYRAWLVRSGVHRLAGPWQAEFVRNYSGLRQIGKLACATVGIIALFIALLRPQWQKKEECVAQEGRDVLIALDVSRSMLATDCQPNRLVCAKEKIKQLLAMLACERVGLLLFSGSAFMQCPMTDDYGAFRMFLDAVDVETISSGTTALDKALEQSMRTFEHMPGKKNKIVLLFTDGEDFSSNLRGIKQQAQQQGMHIFTIGVGSPEGAPIPLFDNKGQPIGHQKDTKGSIVITRLNEGILSTLANDVGGQYVRMTTDDSDARRLQGLIQSYEKEELQDKQYSRLQDKYYYFALVSLVAFLIEWLL